MKFMETEEESYIHVAKKKCRVIDMIAASLMIWVTCRTFINILLKLINYNNYYFSFHEVISIIAIDINQISYKAFTRKKLQHFLYVVLFVQNE